MCQSDSFFRTFPPRAAAWATRLCPGYLLSYPNRSPPQPGTVITTSTGALRTLPLATHCRWPPVPLATVAAGHQLPLATLALATIIRTTKSFHS